MEPIKYRLEDRITNVVHFDIYHLISIGVWLGTLKRMVRESL